MSSSELSREFLDACIYGENLHKIRECIEAGVDVNVQDISGKTAAMFAVIGKTQKIFMAKQTLSAQFLISNQTTWVRALRIFEF